MKGIIIILMCIAIVSVGCGKEETISTPSLDDAQPIVTSEASTETPDTTAEESVEPFDVNVCLSECEDKYQDQLDTYPVIYWNCKGNCYSKLVKQTKDPLDCEPILQFEMSKISYLICIRDSETTDPSVCNKVTGLENTACLEDIGVKTKSADPCQNAPHPFNVNLCIKGVAERLQDPSLCELIIGNKENCFRDAR